MGKAYAFRREVEGTVPEVRERVIAALKEEGFGVLTEIDMKATLKKKLGVDVRPQIILGACNPPLAHQAVQKEPEIGLLLPCNVLVYENEAGKTVVSVVDPEVMLGVVENPELTPIAAEAKARLQRALERV